MSVLDLTNNNNGVHAINLVVENLLHNLYHYTKDVSIIRGPEIVPISDNYDRLLYPSDGAARSERYTRYVDEQHILRTQMTALVPDILLSIKGENIDSTILLPGLVWRRDAVDRTHCGEPHQLDIWRITNQHRLTRDDMLVLVSRILDTLVPGM